MRNLLKNPPLRHFSVLALGVTALVACSGKKKSDDVPAIPPTVVSGASAAPSASVATAVVDAGAPVKAAVPEGPKSYFAALYMQAPVFSEMEYPREGKDDKRPPNKSVRLGYLRNGGKAPVIPEPHAKANCKEGWYELEAGGYVCGKYGTIDLDHPKVKLAPHPPRLDQPLPYDYGYNIAHGTPLYRHVPSHAERLEAEPWLKAPKKKPTTEEGEAATASSAAPVAAGEPPPAPPEDDTPWFMKDWGKEKPKVTLTDLQGDGTVSRRMVRGFYLSLDKIFVSNNSRWWRTSNGSIVSADRVAVTKLRTDFHGVWLDDRAGAPPTNLPIDGSGTAGIPGSSTAAAAAAGVDAGVTTGGAAPITSAGTEAEGRPVAAFVMFKQGAKYVVSADQKKVSAAGPLPHFAGAKLTGVSATVGGQLYFETADGWWFREKEGVVLRTTPPPKDLAAGEKWIDVSLKLEALVSYEGDKPVYATLVSTGRTSSNKEQDHRTPTGSFRIQAKHVASTMDGDVASDGPYSIEDVPWIMYFQGSYALHGAFWHTNFGHVQSHGCVNLAPNDARNMFNWTEPLVPEGWHGVFAGDSKAGTRVIVRD